MISAFPAGAAGRKTHLPSLLGLAAAIVLWLAGDEVIDRVGALDQQFKTALNAVRRTNDDTNLEGLRLTADAARGERRALEMRLRSDDDIQLVRARLVYDLRLKCAAAGIQGCSVRLSEEASSPLSRGSSPTANVSAARPAAGKLLTADSPTLENLGIQKVRAIVTGPFRDREFVTLSEVLAADTSVQWRVNGLLVRGASFELDIERHIWNSLSPQPGAGGGSLR